jgi:hypothetical protein
MNLSTSEKVTLISAFGVAILTILFHIGYRAYFQPDLRYEIGSYYITGSNAITYLKLQNYGQQNAENIAFNTEFDSVITDISTDNSLYTLTIISGGKTTNKLTAKLSDLPPKEAVTIYLAIDNKNVFIDRLKRNFLKSISYKNGVAKTGKPEWLKIIFGIMIATVINGGMFFIGHRIEKKKNKKYYQQIEAIIKLAANAKKSNLTYEEYKSKVTQFLKDTKYRIVGLKKVASSAFDVLDK